MKLATYRRPDGAAHVAIVHDGGSTLFDLTAAANGDGAFASMLALIDAGDPTLEQAKRLFDAHRHDVALNFPIDKVELLSPLPEPRQMRDGMSYETHIRQSGRGMR